MRAYKFRLYPSKLQDQQMQKHLWISKELWNKLLDATIKKYEAEKKFYSRLDLQKMVKDSGLYSQAAQGIAHRLHRALKAKVKSKKEKKKYGFPRFKSFDRMKSLYYPQSGFSIDKKLKVTPFGDININKHREIAGKIKTLSLKRESTGKWYAVFCAEEEKIVSKINNGANVGLDLGTMRLATLSDGTIIKNPKHFKKLEDKLASAQAFLSKKKKGSKNRRKARFKVARIHEKIANTRLDWLHKTANSLLSKYSLIALEELANKEMIEKFNGKSITDASWNRFVNIISYKAESAGCKVVFVDPKNTTKECCGCGKIVEKDLWQRQHDCSSCNLSIDRDINAAINILNRATAGMAGSNACGDETEVSLLKQEAHDFSRG